MIWNNISAHHRLVVQASSIITLNNFQTLQSRAGVYIFMNNMGQVKYIGKAGARRMVEEIASAIQRGKHFGATKVKALYTNSDENALSLERDLINRYNPVNNLR